MNGSINLVSPKNEQLEKEQNRLKSVRMLAFIVMFFVVVIAILAFVINLTLPISSIFPLWLSRIGSSQIGVEWWPIMGRMSQ